MSVSLSFRRLGFALGALLLVALVACKGSNKGGTDSSKTVAIRGTVTFDRIPTVRDANGIPTGLETDPTKFEKNVVAQNLKVALYRKYDIPDPDFPNDRTKDKVFFGYWGYSKTSLTGEYYFSVPPDQEWMVEIQGAIVDAGPSFQRVNLLADPNGMSSTVPQQNRLRYCIRKAPDGTLPPTAPGVNHVAYSKVTNAIPLVTLDFHVGVGDSWFLADTEFDHLEAKIVPKLVPGYSPGLVVGADLNGYAEAGALESTPSGSRVMSILDAFSSVANFQGSNATTAIGPGATLDLHYKVGRAEAAGTFIEWDRSSYPTSVILDPVTHAPVSTGNNVGLDVFSGETHFLGAIDGSALNDDAWDRDQLLILAGRAHIYLQTLSGAYYHQATSLETLSPRPSGQFRSNLDPQMALIEGIPYGLAAVINKSPYLANFSGGSLTYRDIRDLGPVAAGDRTLNSAPVAAALLWNLALKAKAIASPGGPTTWTNIIPANVLPFTALRDTADLSEPISLYRQLKGMQTILPGLVENPSPITDAVVQDILTATGIPAGNIPWPRPSTGPLARLAAAWGENPTSTPAPPASTSIQPFQLSMSQAVLVGGAYDNLSPKELQYASFTISPTRTYALSVDFPGGPLTNGQVEVSFIGSGTPDGRVLQSFRLTDSTSGTLPVAFQSAPGSTSTWVVRVRILSPVTLQPDTTVRINLVPVP